MVVMRTMMGMKACLLVAVLMLCSCGAGMVPLKPYLVQDVKTIEVAQIEAGNSLLVRRVNPLFLAMGSSGLMADAVVVANHAFRYEQHAGPVHQMCVTLFEKTLLQALAAQGFQANSSNKRFWDYFKGSQKSLRESTDGLLHIRLQQMGFWSKAVDDGYFPSLMVVVEMIDPVSREVLYSDRFSMGIDLTSVKVMDVANGYSNILPLGQEFLPYENFNDLLEHADESRDDLLRVVSRAARYISQSLRRPKVVPMEAGAPMLIKSMPDMPSSTRIDAYTLK
ncbi:hypothetical protein D8Y20_07545 [Mariprofundus sp. EBB-1]|nr:hypothetical protein D8Y20_07545 [Mariprofundus sp. EBB-1]